MKFLKHPVFSNPFNGKCIHGRPGARLERGALVNSRCALCLRSAYQHLRRKG